MKRRRPDASNAPPAGDGDESVSIRFGSRKEKHDEKQDDKRPGRVGFYGPAGPQKDDAGGVERVAGGGRENEDSGLHENDTKKKVEAENDIKKKVEREIAEFERTHKESGASPPKVRGTDVHVDFEHIKSEIEKKLSGMEDQRDLGKVIKTNVIKSGGKLSTIPTGVVGMDEILGGGLPKNSLTLLSGTCGTGKSIFGMNFLIDGALRGEPGIYISLEESPEINIQQMKLFGWPVEDLIKKNKLLILQPELYNYDALLTTIEDSVDRMKAKRLVIDSVSTIGMYFEDPYKVRKSLLELSNLLKKLNCTSIAIDEVHEGESSISAYGVEEFVVDGVIMLYLIKRSNLYIRAAVVRKMRGMNHSTKIHPMEIKSPGGIVIYPSQELFEEIE